MEADTLHVHSTPEVLDLAKAAQGIESDYKLALLLGVVPSAVGNWRKGRAHPTDEIAERLAALANYDTGYIVSCIHAARAGTVGQKALWATIAGRLKSNGTPYLVAMAASVGCVTASPDAHAQGRNTDGASVYYVK